MNDIFSSQHSIRAYTAESVSEAELTQIVEAAGYAPSGANSQQ